MAGPMFPPHHQPAPPTTAPRSRPARPPAAVVLAAGRAPAPLLRTLCALVVQRNLDGLWLAPEAFGVVLVPNGPPAAVEGVLASLGPSLPFAVRVTAPVPAGDWALRAGLDAALGWTGAGGVLLSTEAGAVPEACWLARAMAGLADGAADLGLGEVVPPGSGPDAAARYAGLLADLAARLDPDPDDHDPSSSGPAHGQEEAASLAIRGATLAALGGLPVGPAGGVAGLLAALRRRDGRIRHLAGMRVEAMLPPAPVEPAFAARRRLQARRAVRDFWTRGIGVFERETPEFRRWAARLGLPAGSLGAALSAPGFGAAWMRVVAESPVLAPPTLLPPSALPGEIARARVLLGLARLRPPPAPRGEAAARRPGGWPAQDQRAGDQRAGGLPPGSDNPEGSCMLRNPGGAWNRAGSCGP